MNMVKSKAFRAGFAVGFASPYRMVLGERFRYKLGERDLVSASWVQVGKSIREAMDKESVRHVKGAERSRRGS